MQQLDIFADTREQVLVNLLAEALQASGPAAAQAAAEALRAEVPGSAQLPAAGVLVDALAAEQLSADAPWPDAAAALAACAHLQQVLQPAALQLLGRQASGPWLAARWASLARRARQLPFDTEQPQAHAAALWVAAGDWAAAAHAAGGIESWRRRPQPLAWMAQARFHLQGLDAAWPLLCELAWIAPARLPGVLQQLPSAPLQRHVAGFEARFDGDFASGAAWAWWPAWLLVDEPKLLPVLELAQAAGASDAERGFVLVQALLRHERHGRQHEVLPLRRQLQALQPVLFAAYLAGR